ncbi:ribonuclease H-like domain-containing protein [Tanacetum coccineum]
MGHFAREYRAPRSKDNRNWNQGSSSKASDMAAEEIQANMALMAFSDSEMKYWFKASTYKRGHKEYLMGLLRTELENVKEEKEGFEFKIAKPTSLDLSYSGLEEFKQPEVNEYGPRDSSVKPTTGCDKESDNSKENTDDSLKQKTDSSSDKSPLKVDKDWKEKFFCPANHVREEEPKKARENNDAPIIEDWVSDDEDDVESIHKVEKKTVIPTATKKEFVKPEKPVRRSVSCPNVHKHMVPRAVLMKTGLKTVNTVRSVNTVRPFSTARSFNTVRPSYTAHPKSTVHCARPRTYFQNQAQSTVQRPLYKRTTLTKRSYNQNVNTGRQNVNTGKKGIKREYSVARTPQQNGVAERKNRTLIEAARTMLADSKLPTTFWAEAVSTALLCTE